jgi:hypothetical protein
MIVNIFVPPGPIAVEKLEREPVIEEVRVAVDT